MYSREHLRTNLREVSIKRFLKRNLADVGPEESMNALADTKHTKKECHSVICTP